MSELALPYVPIDPGIEESERMALFVDALELHDDPMAPWHVVSLLLWVGGERPDGNIGRMPLRRLAKICRWSGDPDDLFRALVSAGWVIANDDGTIKVEGWSRHGGRVLAEREKWRDKKRKQRSQVDDSDKCPGDVPGTSRGVSEKSRTEGEGEGEGELDREIDARENSSDQSTKTPGRQLADIEAVGYERYGPLSGRGLAAVRKLMPITETELADAMTTDGTSWTYAARVIESMRTEALRPATGPPRGGRSGSRRRPLTNTDLSRIGQEWAMESSDE